MENSNAPVWFITGCSTGFGRELANALLERGMRCVVTARDVSKIEDLVQGHESQVLALPLDVTNSSQISEAVAQAEKRFGALTCW